MYINLTNFSKYLNKTFDKELQMYIDSFILEELEIILLPILQYKKYIDDKLITYDDIKKNIEDSNLSYCKREPVSNPKKVYKNDYNKYLFIIEEDLTYDILTFIYKYKINIEENAITLLMFYFNRILYLYLYNYNFLYNIRNMTLRKFYKSDLLNFINEEDDNIEDILDVFYQENNISLVKINEISIKNIFKYYLNLFFKTFLKYGDQTKLIFMFFGEYPSIFLCEECNDCKQTKYYSKLIEYFNKITHNIVKIDEFIIDSFIFYVNNILRHFLKLEENFFIYNVIVLRDLFIISNYINDDLDIVFNKEHVDNFKLFMSGTFYYNRTIKSILLKDLIVPNETKITNYYYENQLSTLDELINSS
jgi:hypothetical protein